MRHRDYQYNPTTGQAELVADWDDGEPEPEIAAPLPAIDAAAVVDALASLTPSSNTTTIRTALLNLRGAAESAVADEQARDVVASAAQIAGVNEKIDYMTSNGGLG